MLKEPVWILVGGGTTLVQAVLALLIAFKVPITGEQQAAITTIAGLLIAAYTRTHVTPMATLPAGAAAKIAEAKAANS